MILEDDVCFHKSWNYMLKPIKNCLFHDLIYIGYNSYNENINKLNGSFQENPLVKNVIDFITRDKKRSICTPFS